jgi:uncharacterized tellurite resistance protein B-like protein
VALDGVTTEAVRLAAHMAWVDDHVHTAELEAIRAFVATRVVATDHALAERLVARALEQPLAPSDLQLSISTIHAVGSHRQHRLTVRLLAQVAAADGALDPRELAFVNEVGAGLGIGAEELADLLAGRTAEV